MDKAGIYTAGLFFSAGSNCELLIDLVYKTYSDNYNY